MTVTPASAAASQQAAVDAALLVLKSMGLSLDDLLSAGVKKRLRESVQFLAGKVRPLRGTSTEYHQRRGHHVRNIVQP